MLALKRVAFMRKQRALRQAVLVGDRMASRKRQQLLGACLAAWRLRTRQYSRVAAAFESHMLTLVSDIWRRWRRFCNEQVITWLPS